MSNSKLEQVARKQKRFFAFDVVTFLAMSSGVVVALVALF